MISIQQGQIVGGKYRLTRAFASGGMGSVWAAEHVNLDMPVAVKFMDPNFAAVDGLRARFEREAKAVAQLRTPNVVQIHDYGLQEDTPYIVMELLKGEDLGARLKRDGKLPLTEALPILSQLGKALRRAHEEGIVHRDLKPANVFLTEQDDEVLVKVLDFGIAKLLRTDLVTDATKTGTIMGSPHYMSPEQVRGVKEIDHRTDLWSLGVIIYRTLTGRLPFPGTQLGDIFLKICTESPMPPSQICPDIDPRVDHLIEKALAVDPANRFQTAMDMRTALSALSPPAEAPHFVTSAVTSGGEDPADAVTNPFPGQPSSSNELSPSERAISEEPSTDAPVTQQVHSRDGTNGRSSTARNLPGRSRKVLAGLGFIGGLLLIGAIAYVRSMGGAGEHSSAAAEPTTQAPPASASATSDRQAVPVGAAHSTTISAVGTGTESPSTGPTPSSPRPMPNARGSEATTVRSGSAVTKPVTTSTAASNKSKRFGF